MAQEQIVDWDQLYPGRFFKGGDILEGEKKIVTISAVELEELEGNKGLKGKGILTFEGEKMQLALNKTNGICLREMFGRKPYEWIGRRFAMYQDQFEHQPCIRIWGSPELTQDLVVTVDLGRRRKPFKMTMHAMQTQRPAQRPSGNVRRLDARQPSEPLGDRAMELMKLMATAKTFEEVMDIEADVASETFNGRESKALTGALARRRKQLDEAEGNAQNAHKEEDDDIPFK